MPRRIRPSLMVALALGISSTAGACNQELQQHTDVLLDALDADDYTKFQQIAGSELLDDVGEGRFLDLAATYGHLGALKDKTRHSTGVSNGESYVGYTLEYATGEVDLKVVSRSDKLDGFDIGGPTWTKAWRGRHRQSLDDLLAALKSGDRAAARASIHGSIPDSEVDGLLANVGALGEAREVELTDETIPEFRVAYASATFLVTLRLSAEEIVGFSFRPA